ncbi:MAG TPA: molybdenum cofactor biosynthesis protein B [Vicinamibacterales bacterium]|nr:molybdenum cofactor biosynthesis protein B [Vicinamibacterales bacterium]
MPGPSHRASPATAVRTAVVTVSDTRTTETDTSGRAIADALLAVGHDVAARDLVPDDAVAIAAVVERHARSGDVRVVIVTGGTGLSPRDVTVDALAPLFDKPLVGFGELFRRLSFDEIGPAAMLSRATAGVVGTCAVFVLPGSEHAVRLAMTRLILPELGHVAAELIKR